VAQTERDTVNRLINLTNKKLLVWLDGVRGFEDFLEIVYVVKRRGVTFILSDTTGELEINSGDDLIEITKKEAATMTLCKVVENQVCPTLKKERRLQRQRDYRENRKRFVKVTSSLS